MPDHSPADRPASPPHGTNLRASPPSGAARGGASERSWLAKLHELQDDLEAEPSLSERLGIVLDALIESGFDRAVLTVRDAQLDPVETHVRGLGSHAIELLRSAARPGIAWRRRLAELEGMRAGRGFLLDASDEWVRREFAEELPGVLVFPAAGSGSGAPVFLLPLRAHGGRIIATLLLSREPGAPPPAFEELRLAELIAQHGASLLEDAELGRVAQQRGERLQRLQDVGARLARSLDEREIVRELARQVARAMPCDGIVVAHPDPEKGVVTTALRLVRGIERPRAPQPLGAGPLAEVVRGGRPVRIDDFAPSQGADDIVGDAEPARSILAVPMRLGHRLVGVLAVHAEARAAYGLDDEEVLQTIASQAATAIVNARLYDESQRERRQSEALADIARAVSESLRLGEVLRLILRHATALLRTQGGCVSLREGESALEVVAGVGTGEALVGMRVPVRASLAGRAILQGSYIIVNDVARDADGDAPADMALDGSRAAQKTVIVPLVTARGAIGCLSVMDRSADFAEEDARVLQRLADQVAVAIVNARLFEEVAAATREWTVAFDSVASGMMLLDAEGRITRCNARSLQLADVADASTLAGRHFHEAVLGEREPCESCAHLAAIREGRIARATHRSPGRGRIFDLVASPHPEGGAVVTFDDVTAHHALAERHRLVLDTTSDAILMTDPHRRIVFANPAAAELFGRSGSIIGLALAELVLPDLATETLEHETRALAGEPRQWECVIARPDGERRTVAASAQPLHHVGEVGGVVTSLRDVTDERRARDAVVQSETRYRNLFETATDAIYTLDANGAFTSVNQATCSITRFPREELLGRNSTAMLEEAEADLVSGHFRAALAGESRRYECHFTTRDGERRLLSVTNTPIRSRDSVVGVLGIARDITDERRMAQQLLQQEKLAAVGQLVSGVAHELNNPLAGVMAFSQLALSQASAGGDQYRAMEMIHSEARRAAKIVSNLLTFARQHQPEKKATDINQVVLDTVELRRYALRMHQIELDMALDPALPLTLADGFQLQQVVLNLISNAELAVSNGWEGEKRITIRTARDGERLVLRVADSGAGIPEANVERIFNPFFTTRPAGKGSGLGLSASDGIVREHGGRIRVESPPGGGAAFIVELPWVEPPAASTAIAPAPRAAAPRPRTILVVDDEPSIRLAVTTWLGNHGHSVDAVASGGEALTRLEGRRYDAILLDLRMPDMSGDSIFHELEKRDPEQARRIVFVTGDVQSESTREFVRATGRPCLSKPFMLDELATVLLAGSHS